MTDIIYNSAKLRFMDAGWDLDEGNDDFQVALVASGYVEDQDNHDFFNDITNELSGTGYTAGGEDLANQATTQDNTDNEAVFDGDDITWTGLDAGTIAALIGYVNTAGSPGTDPLMFNIDQATGLPLVTNGGDVTIAWAAEGIVNLT